MGGKNNFAQINQITAINNTVSVFEEMLIRLFSLIDEIFQEHINSSTKISKKENKTLKKVKSAKSKWKLY